MVKEETLKELALSRSEYNLILDKLDREPNDLELGLFGALWSEHCGYKHTKKLLRSIKSTSEFTLTDWGAFITTFSPPPIYTFLNEDNTNDCVLEFKDIPSSGKGSWEVESSLSDRKDSLIKQGIGSSLGL